jgi:hypothetical protein
MTVYCIDENSEYKLIGGVADSNWVKIIDNNRYLTASYALSSSGIGYSVSSSWASSSISSSYTDTASYINFIPQFSVSASWASSSISSSYTLTASYVSSSNIYGNIYALSSSWASRSLSASYAPVEPAYSSSIVNILATKQDDLVTGSRYPITSSWSLNSIVSNTSLYASQSQWAVSSSWASRSLSASYLPVGTYPITSSWSLTASYVSSSNIYGNIYALSASWASRSLSASYANTASWAINAFWASSSLSSSWASQSLSSSYAETASYAYTASYALNYTPQISCSWASRSLSASMADALISNQGFLVTNTSSIISTIYTGDSNNIGLIIQGTVQQGITIPFNPGFSSDAFSYLWYAADRETSSYTNGETVSAWHDYLDNTNDLGYVYSNTPTFKTSSINGLPSMLFTTGRLFGTNISKGQYWGALTKKTCFVVFKQTVCSSQWWNKNIIGCDTGGGNQNKWIIGIDDTGTLHWYDESQGIGGADSLTSSVGAIDTGSWHILGFNKDVNLFNAYIDGASLISNQTLTYYPTGFGTGTPITVGQAEWAVSPGNNSYEGEMAEIIYYTGSLGDTDRQKVEGTKKNYMNLLLLG